jgi:hypothetical protein
MLANEEPLRVSNNQRDEESGAIECEVKGENDKHDRQEE